MELVEKIFDGAVEEFQYSGFRFTMDALAKRIGISKRTLYETIPSKEAVIEMVIDRTFEDIKEQQKVILNHQGLDTNEKIKQLFTIVPTYAKVIDYRRIMELKQAFPKLYQKVEQCLESDWEPSIMLLRQGMKEGVIRKTNVVVLKLLLCEVYEQLINGETLIRNQITYEEAMQEMMEIIFEGLLVK